MKGKHASLQGSPRDSSQGSPIVQFESVSFGYRDDRHPVLENLSAAVASGSVTVVLGPNGAGKTTLLHLALGWLSPWKGRILFEGRPMKSYARQELGRAIAIVPQSERIPFEYSVLEYVLLGRAPHLPPLGFPGSQDVAIAEACIGDAGIGALADRDITALSGGERQLATIARALAQKPRLLILDEPSSHLDLANKARLLRLIGSLSAKGITVLFSTHEPDVAGAVASHVMLVRDGNVRETGTVDAMLNPESLGATYGLPVEVIEMSGKKVLCWTPEPLFWGKNR